MENGYLRHLGRFIAEGFQAFMSIFPEESHVNIGIVFFVFILSLPFLAAIYFLTLGKRQLESSATYHIPILGDFADIVRRVGWMSIVVLAIVATYRISDTTMGVMAGPLYVDLGYSKSGIGAVKGAFGISVLIFGVCDYRS